MIHLSAAEIAELRAEMAAELERLARSVSRGAEATKPVALDQASVGRVSRADAMQNQAMSVATQGRSQARHAELAEAIDRLNKGTFGVCQRCGAPVPFGRLMVFPETRFCAACGAKA
jgi:DnaK suppressor protein